MSHGEDNMHRFSVVTFRLSSCSPRFTSPSVDVSFEISSSFLFSCASSGRGESNPIRGDFYKQHKTYDFKRKLMVSLTGITVEPDLCIYDGVRKDY